MPKLDERNKNNPSHKDYTNKFEPKYSPGDKLSPGQQAKLDQIEADLRDSGFKGLDSAEKAAAEGSAVNKADQEKLEPNIVFNSDGKKSTGGSKKVTFWARIRKPAFIAGAAGTGVMGWSLFTSQTLQPLHMLNLFQQFHISEAEEVSDSMATRIWRYMRDPSSPGNRRLGEYGKARAKIMDAKMARAGYVLTPSAGSGSLMVLDIDPAATNSTIDGVKKTLVDAGVDPSNILDADGGKIRVTNLNKNYAPIRNTRLIKQALVAAGYSKKTAWLHARVLKKRAGVGFHFLGYLDNKAKDKFKNWLENRKKNNKNGVDPDVRKSNVGTDDPLNNPDGNGESQAIPDGDSATAQGTAEGTQNAGSSDATKAKIKSSLKVGGGGVAAIAGVGCLLYAVGEQADELSYENVNVPLVRFAWELLSVASQIMAGENVDAEEVGYYVETLFQEAQKASEEDKQVIAEASTIVDSGGAEAEDIPASSWVDAESIQHELGNKDTGIAPPPEVSTLGEDGNILSNTIGSLPVIDDVCKVVNSGVGQSLLFAADFAAGPFSAVGGAAVGMLAGPPIVDFVTNWLTDEAVDVEVAGATVGTYGNVGTKLGVNELNIPRGGRPLSEEQRAAWKGHSYQELKFAQAKKPLTDKLFDKTDARSFVSSFARTVPTDKIQTISSVLRSPLIMLSSMKHIIPGGTAYAQSHEPYDYGFDSYGVGLDELNDPRFENPFLNEDILKNSLAADESIADLHRDWGEKCFGVKINDSNFSVQILEGVRPSEIEDECAEHDGKEKFDRYKFYVLSIMTMKGVFCFDNSDPKACTDLGAGEGSGSSGGSSSGGATLDGVTCPDDLEAHSTIDGYYRMPDAPNGEYIFGGGTPPEQRWGSEQLVCVLHSVALAYDEQYGEESKLKIGDLNATGHASHNIGIAVDLNAVGNVVSANNQIAGYNTEATIQLGKLFVDTGALQDIWWCDNGDGSIEAIRAYGEEKGNPVNIQCLPGHYDHFHVNVKDEFALPGSYTP